MHTKSSEHSYPYSVSPISSASRESSHISSWGTVPTLIPSTPYSAPIPLPVCCLAGHPSPASYSPIAVANPVLQQPYDTIVPPHLAPYSSEPATHPPVTTLTFRLTPHPNTRIPSMDVTLSCPRPGPLTVLDVHDFIYRTLSRPIVHSDLRSLTEQVAHDAVSAAFHTRTANDPNAYARGMSVGDRMGGASCIVGIVPTGEPGVWEVRLVVPRRR
ncbi:hypothetical protein E4T56_gene14654 [Termitomyces sp. T112]|nr:hypothetical protein E4T56_gene14654 [Termitomyces sp. T112]KAH0582220.1 hypothetical protein H2248_011866 [Termitomyces sp. 'cryptogamus']